jgi:hypothetical protein
MPAPEGGYQRVVTSFDGKFSIRVFVPNLNSTIWNDGGLQIRHNKESHVSLIWNGLIARRALSGRAGNRTGLSGSLFELENARDWSATWGISDFASGSGGILPEQRRYLWTTTDVTDKTVYYLTLMVGASSHTNTETTGIFMKIEQIQAN